MQGSRKRSHDEGKAGVRGGGQREGSAGRCGRWMDARGRRTNGEERRPAGHKKCASALQNDPAGARKNSAPLFYKSGLSGVRKKSALLLYKTTRRACAKNAPLLYKNGPARAKKARPCVKQGRAAGLRPPSPSGGSAARRASAC